MKVYIIDDEPKIRRGLAHAISSYRPQWPPAGAAGDVEAARSDPDFENTELLFLDIQLPGMDGLSFLEELRAKGSTLDVVMISGFAEFSFAQKAISMQASEYLLKPIEISKVYSLVDSFELRRGRSQKEQAAKAEIQKDLHSLREKFFSKVLFGTEPFDKNIYERRLNQLGLKDSQFILAAFDYIESGRNQDFQSRNIQKKLADTLSSYLPREENLFLIFLPSGAIAILLGSDSELTFILETFQENPEHNGFMSGFSLIHDSLSDLPVAYNEASRFLGSSDSAESNSADESSDQTLYVNALTENSGSYHRSVQKAIEFISRKYKSDLSLKIIAEHAHLHTTYLSDLFKKETEHNLGNYITDFRLCKAKDELLHTEAKIAVIAESVGFGDYHYFTQVFSRRVGVSPRKYRNSHAEA